MEKTILTLKEVAKLLDCSLPTLHKHLKEGLLSVKLRRRRYVLVSDLNDFIEKNRGLKKHSDNIN